MSRRPPSPSSPCWWMAVRVVLPGLGRIHVVERWAAGREVDRGEGTGGHLRLGPGAGCPRGGGGAVWTALLWVVVGAIAGATGSRLVQYGILGAVLGAGPSCSAVHSFVEGNDATGQGRHRR